MNCPIWLFTQLQLESIQPDVQYLPSLKCNQALMLHWQEMDKAQELDQLAGQLGSIPGASFSDPSILLTG